MALAPVNQQEKCEKFQSNQAILFNIYGNPPAPRRVGDRVHLMINSVYYSCRNIFKTEGQKICIAKHFPTPPSGG